jgi:cobalamin biosynthesis protein CobD/CbiB
MSGALQVRLGGDNFYDGEFAPAPFIGERFSCPSTEKARQAIKIAAAVSFLGVVAALLLKRKTR